MITKPNSKISGCRSYVLQTTFLARNQINHIFRIDDFSFQCIDQVQAPNNSDEIDRLLITKEAYWSAQLFSLAPHGLNKRKEFHSRNRICYN